MCSFSAVSQTLEKEVLLVIIKIVINVLLARQKNGRQKRPFFQQK